MERAQKAEPSQILRVIHLWGESTWRGLWLVFFVEQTSQWELQALSWETKYKE